MLHRTYLARVTALAAAIAIATVSLPAIVVHAQDSSFETYKRGARAGEDGSTGVGADAGNTSQGKAKRDKNGNASTATAGDGGQSSGGNGGGDGGGSSKPLPENAETLEALGVLDDVTQYDLDILVGLNIPIELLPPPVDEVTSGPSDVNTGGQGTTGETATGGSAEGAPAGGSTTTAAEDGSGSTSKEDKKRDRAERRAAKENESSGG